MTYLHLFEDIKEGDYPGWDRFNGIILPYIEFADEKTSILKYVIPKKELNENIWIEKNTLYFFLLTDIIILTVIANSQLSINICPLEEVKLQEKITYKVKGTSKTFYSYQIGEQIYERTISRLGHAVREEEVKFLDDLWERVEKRKESIC